MAYLALASFRTPAIRALYYSLGLTEMLSDQLGSAKVRARSQTSTARSTPGITILIPERNNASVLEQCLNSIEQARAEIEEPSQVLVVASGATEPQYAHLTRRNSDVRWLFFNKPLFFSAAVKEGLRVAEHDWIYLLNSDMVVDRWVLQTLLPWRDQNVFAIASQIFFKDSTKRREETGWTAFRQEGLGPIEILDITPENQTTVRGTLYAGGGASLFQKRLLERFLRGSRVYEPFYWEDAEWGARAWRTGYQVLFCPESKVWHEHRATNRRFFSEDEIDRIMKRNRVLFHLRNQPRAACFEQFKEDIACLEGRSMRELFHPARLFHILWGRWNSRNLPFRDLPLQDTWAKYYSKPRTEGKPLLLVVSPYVVYPPAHGGARRITGLLKALERHFDLVLLSDEGESYGQTSQKYFRDLTSVHLVRGRPALPPNGSGRMERVDNHSHSLMAEHLRFLVSTYQPAAVQVEYTELSKLISVRDGDQSRWFLTLHDVNFSENGNLTAEDIYERKWIASFDGLITCSKEDAALLNGLRVVVIPNGTDVAVNRYRPSPGGGPILFMGPFRYSPNVQGIRAFLECAYRPLVEKIPGLELWILAGAGARAAVSEIAAFHQPGIRFLDYAEHPDQFLDQCAITINPLTGVRGSCLKVIESIAAGRVCVSTLEGARGFLDAGFTGLICKDRVEQFVQPIEQLLLNDQYRRGLEQPDPNILEPFLWNHAGQLQTEFYQRCTTTERNASKHGF
jgi:GT2 family glycosyltransferase